MPAKNLKPCRHPASCDKQLLQVKLQILGGGERSEDEWNAAREKNESVHSIVLPSHPHRAKNRQVSL